MATIAELDAGQQRQVEQMRALQEQGVAMGGWKLGQTSGGSRDAFGEGFRAFGYVRADRILPSGADLQWQDMAPGGIETEACFVLQQDLVPQNGQPVSAAQARAAVWIAAGFELNQSRLGSDASHPDRIADDLSNWGIVLGEAAPVPQDWDPSQLEVSIHSAAGEANRVAAAGFIDDHFESLALLANRLNQFGCALRKGETVITGAYCKVKEPAAGLWTGDFQEIGKVSINILR